MSYPPQFAKGKRQGSDKSPLRSSNSSFTSPAQGGGACPHTSREQPRQQPYMTGLKCRACYRNGLTRPPHQSASTRHKPHAKKIAQGPRLLGREEDEEQRQNEVGPKTKIPISIRHRAGSRRPPGLRSAGPSEPSRYLHDDHSGTALGFGRDAAAGERDAAAFPTKARCEIS